VRTYSCCRDAAKIDKRALTYSTNIVSLPNYLPSEDPPGNLDARIGERCCAGVVPATGTPPSAVARPEPAIAGRPG
jgi:hypothetical protein